MEPQTLLFASHNRHKVQEVRELLPASYSLISLPDISWTTEIPEPFETFEENAKAKASFVYRHSGISCFADDSGLMVDALGGKPGVYSARYAGEDKSSAANIEKLLLELGKEVNRSARFIAVIAYQLSAETIHLFHGMVEGSISFAPEGTGGFGYDPVFIPSGFDLTFGQLPVHVKNRISHRAIAMQHFIHFVRHQKAIN